MAAKGAQLSIKVGLYYKLICGRQSRLLAREYSISQATVLRYANDVLEMLRDMPECQTSPVLRSFVFKTIRAQPHKFDDDIKLALMPILQPYLDEAALLSTARKEGANSTLTARVPQSLHDRFMEIVEELSEVRPGGVSTSELLREIIENYCENYTPKDIEVVPAGKADEGQTKLVAELSSLLKRFGIDMQSPP